MPVAKHCCDRMRMELQKGQPGTGRPWSPDTLVAYIPNFDEYGLPVHVQRRGVDPLTGSVPIEFQDESWYRQN